MFANVSLPFYFLICPNIRQPQCDIVTDGLVDLRSCSCKPPGFVCLTDVLEAPCHYMPSGCVLGSGLSRLDLHTADTLTGALGWAEPERRRLIVSVWFRILKCVSCEDKSPKVLGNYICKVLHWTNVAQTFLNYFIQFLQNRWFASLLLHFTYHMFYTLNVALLRTTKNHTHTLLPSYYHYARCLSGYGTPLLCHHSFLWPPSPCRRCSFCPSLKRPVEWGHRCPSFPYHAVLNSTSWVIVKLSQSSEQTITHCWAPEQGCVTMDTCVCICVCDQNNLPLGSQIEVSLGEWQYLSWQQWGTFVCVID